MQAPQPDWQKALESLSQAAGARDFPMYPEAMYYSAACARQMGMSDLAQIAAKPNEAQNFINAASGKFGDAARRFGDAASLSAERAKKPMLPANEVNDSNTLVYRAKADQAEMLLRMNQPKQAQEALAKFETDAAWQKSPSAALTRYHLSHAAFLQRDFLVAGRNLAALAPFANPVWGNHARYLMARVFHLTGDRASAAPLYAAVVQSHRDAKKLAEETLKRPDLLKNAPWERHRLEQLARATPPDYVMSAELQSAALLYEAGKFAEALAALTEFDKTYPQSKYKAEAQLRTAICHVQLKDAKAARAILNALKDKNPPLQDQILFWSAKAILADPPFDEKNPQVLDAAHKEAVALFRAAIDANQRMGDDPDAKLRRFDIKLDLADAYQLTKQVRESMGEYESLFNENQFPDKRDLIFVRFMTAAQLANDFGRVDQQWQQFAQLFPQSALLSAAMFRWAENGYQIVRDRLKKNPNANKQEVTAWWAESAQRYQQFLEKFPETDKAPAARYALAMTLFQRDDFAAALKLLEAIPAADRSGDLTYAFYFNAECLIRNAPLRVDDAAQAGELTEAMESSLRNLDAFVSGMPKAPEVPDALLKTGYCQTRLALMQANRDQKNAALNNARVTFDKLIQVYPNSFEARQSILEKSRCTSEMGDKNGAINELAKFQQPPFFEMDAAPAAWVLAATLRREVGRWEEAAKVLGELRTRYEQFPKKTPHSLALIRLHQGFAWIDGKKWTEARQALEGVYQIAPQTLVGFEAALRLGQVKVASAQESIADARQKLQQQPNATPEQRGPLVNQQNKGFDDIRDAAAALVASANEAKQQFAKSEVRAKILYEAAWAERIRADREIASATDALAETKRKQMEDEARKAANNMQIVVQTPSIPRSDVPIQPAEGQARALYQVVVQEFPDLLLAVNAGLELAEMFAERAEWDRAIELLKTAKDAEPADKPLTDILIDPIRLRLGGCLIQKKQFDAALELFDVVSRHPQSPQLGLAHLHAAECLEAQGKPDEALKRYVMFRDNGQFQNLPGVTDLALVHIGDIHAAKKEWEPARQVYENCANRFPNGPYAAQARYGLGNALQNLKQYDAAVNNYIVVTNLPDQSLAAKANLQIGFCRADQKRYGEAVAAFLTVPYSFDAPELAAPALLGAAKAYAEEKRPDAAKRILEKLLKDHSKSEFAAPAKQLLDALNAPTKEGKK